MLVTCRSCDRKVPCIAVSDGTTTYRPLGWRYPLVGICPQCQDALCQDALCRAGPPLPLP